MEKATSTSYSDPKCDYSQTSGIFTVLGIIELVLRKIIDFEITQEGTAKILNCCRSWLKLVPEGENELIINVLVICILLVHNDILVAFTGHFLELLMHIYPTLELNISSSNTS